MRPDGRPSSCLSMRFSSCYRRAMAIGLLGSGSIVSMGALAAADPIGDLVARLLARGPGQVGAEVDVVGSTGSIPKDRYKTWSLFLVCNPKWLTPDMSADLYRLYKQFKSFGWTIGDDNLAVWFWKEKKSGHDPDLADNVDVERSIKFCKLYNLAPSAGPHLLIVSSYPDLTKAPGEHGDYELGPKSPKEITDLLGKLTDELLLKGWVPSKPGAAVTSRSAVAATTRPATASASSPDGLWIRLLEATQQSLKNFGCYWAFKVHAGELEAELRPCPKTD
jgi:hypothetical protein